MAKNDKRRIRKLAHISPEEYTELDKMIATAIELKGQDVQVRLTRTLDRIRIPGLGCVSVYFFAWAIGDDERGVVGWRRYGAEEEVAAFQAECSKYFADGVKAKSVVMHTPDGRMEKLR